MSYPQAVANVRVAAAVLRRLAEFLVTLGVDDFEFIGHSLGAHVMSLVAKGLENKVRTLVGLDVAGFLFEGYREGVRFSANDANTTIAIKTSSLGISEPVYSFLLPHVPIRSMTVEF